MTVERFLMPTKIGAIVKERIPGWLKIVFTFPLIIIGWLLFRVESDVQILTLIKVLSSKWSLMTIIDSIRSLHFGVLATVINVELGFRVIRAIIILIAVEFIQYNNDDLGVDLRIPVVFRAILYVFVIYLIHFGSAGVASQFIYFQF